MSRVKILSILLVVVVIGSSHAATDCTGLTGEHLTNCTLHPENYVVVPTKSGPIGGSSSYSIPAGRDYWYFKGIPYAQPPVGKLRMRNPVKAKPWTATRWSLQHGNACVQTENPPVYKGSEDCLTLNVYLPKNRCSTTNRCPIIFNVHTSNFYTGDGNSDQLGPERFVGEDVILVVPNYRLTAFGFSNTGDQNIQGNAALMDIVMALLWIKENIANFGGERAQVTLSGDGATMGYLCTAEYTAGLFSRVQVRTTSSLSGWTFQPDPQKIIKELAAGMNLTYTGMPDLAEQLRNAPVQDIIMVAANMRQKSQGVIPYRKEFPFSPAVDNCMPKLIPSNPRDFMDIILETGDHKVCHGVPIIIGSVTSEGKGKADILTTPTLLQDIEDDHELLVPPVCVNAPKGSNESIAIGNKLFDYYFSNGGVTDLNYYKYKLMLISLNGNIAFARYNQKSGIKVYVYLYSFCSDTNYMRRTFVPEYSCPQQVGPCLADDAFLTFYQTALPLYLTTYGNVSIIYHNDRTDADRRLSAQMMRFFVNFARIGNPNGCDPLDPLLGIEWKPVSDFTDIQTLYFDSTLKMDHHAFQDAIDFWETLCTV